MHSLWLQNSAKGEAARCQAYPSKVNEKNKGRFFWTSIALTVESYASEYLLLSNLAKRPAAKLYRRTHDLVRLFLNSFSFYSLSTYSLQQQSSLHAQGIRAVWNITHLFRPSTPHGIPLRNSCFFYTFEGLTCWRTSLNLCQCMHSL